MEINLNREPTHRRRTPGFTLVESAVATVLVGGLLVVALNMVGASRLTETRYAERERALLLAEDLLQEVLSKSYEEPEDGVTVAFGLELGEQLSVRAGLDDADDYHGYTESPPADADGNAIPGAEGFTRAAQVHWVDPDDPKTVSQTETGVKRVIVTVGRGGRPNVWLRGYVTDTWPDADAMEDFSP